MIGETLDNKLEIKSLLGSGGSGSVYRAFHRGLQRDVAVKVLNYLHEGEQASLLRFQREGALLEKLVHPNIVRFYSFGSTGDGRPYAVLEYLEGRSLSDKLAADKTLKRDELRSTFDQLLTAVSAAHERGIVHRDLKPSNVFLIEAPNAIPHVKVLDFGLAKSMEVQNQKLTKTGAMLGTPLYMSPEQCAGKEAGVASDVYSIGCMLFECVLGKRPFDGESQFEVMMAHMMQAPITTGEISSPALHAVLKKALAKEPSERFQSCAEFREALDEALNLTVSQDLVLEGKPKRKAASKKPRYTIVVAATAAVLCTVLAALYLVDYYHKHQIIELAETIRLDIEKGEYTSAQVGFSDLAQRLAHEETNDASPAVDAIISALIERYRFLAPGIILNQKCRERADLLPAGQIIFDKYVRLPPKFLKNDNLVLRAAVFGAVVNSNPKWDFHGVSAERNAQRAWEDFAIAKKIYALGNSNDQILYAAHVVALALLRDSPSAKTPTARLEMLDNAVRAFYFSAEGLQTKEKVDQTFLAQVYFWLAQTLIEEKNYDEASDNYDRAITLCNDANIRYEWSKGLASSLLMKNRFAEAQEVLADIDKLLAQNKKTITMHTEDPFLLDFYKGWAAMGVGDTAACERYEREALRNPQGTNKEMRADALFYLANALHAQRKEVEALRSSQQSLDIYRKLLQTGQAGPLIQEKLANITKTHDAIGLALDRGGK